MYAIARQYDNAPRNAHGGQTEEMIGSLAGHSGAVSALCNEGLTLASASTDGTVRVWDLTTGEVRHTIHCESAVRSICFANCVLGTKTETREAH